MTETFRDKLINLLSSDSEEQKLIRSLLNSDEWRALHYMFVTVPSTGRIDPNRIPRPPFSERDMRRFLKSAGHKITDYTIDRIMDDEPTMLL